MAVVSRFACLARCVKGAVVALISAVLVWAPVAAAFGPVSPVQGIKKLGPEGTVTGLPTSLATNGVKRFGPWAPIVTAAQVIVLLTELGEIGFAPVDPSTDTQPPAPGQDPYPPVPGQTIWWVSSSANNVYTSYGWAQGGRGYTTKESLCSAIGGTITGQVTSIHWNCAASNGNNVLEAFTGSGCPNGGTYNNDGTGQCTIPDQQECPPGWAKSGSLCYKPWLNPGFNGPLYAVDPADGQLKPHPNAPDNAGKPAAAPAAVGFAEVHGTDANGAPVRQRITGQPGGGVKVEQWVELDTPGGNKETERQKIDIDKTGQPSGQERTVTPGSIAVTVNPPALELPTDYAREPTLQAQKTVVEAVQANTKVVADDVQAANATNRPPPVYPTESVDAFNLPNEGTFVWDVPAPSLGGASDCQPMQLHFLGTLRTIDPCPWITHTRPILDQWFIGLCAIATVLSLLGGPRSVRMV